MEEKWQSQKGEHLNHEEEKEGRAIKRQNATCLYVPNAGKQKCLIDPVQTAVITVGDLS